VQGRKATLLLAVDVCASVQEQARKWHRADERRGTERRNAGDRARRANVDVCAVLDENARGVLLLRVDGEMQSREAVVGDPARLRRIVCQDRPQPVDAAEGCGLKDR
jgi:hypothetical protein